MFEVSLFLGFPRDVAFDAILRKINPEILALFIQPKGVHYLQEVHYQGSSYLGKFIGEINDLNDLFLLGANISSLLKKIVPEYPYDPASLLLFPIPVPETRTN